jgi:hypothetical protein
MYQNTTAVLYSLAAYAVWFLLPLVVSIALYKIFPSSTSTAEGAFSNWKIKAGGAVGAYVILFLLGRSGINRVQDMISGMSVCTWTVHGHVILKDKDGNDVPGNTLLQTLRITLQPDIITKQNQVVDVRIPSQGEAVPEKTLNFSIPEFGDQTIDLQEVKYRDRTDVKHRRMDFNEIVIKEFPKPLPSQSPNSHVTASYQTPLSGAGPTPLPAASP